MTNVPEIGSMLAEYIEDLLVVSDHEDQALDLLGGLSKMVLRLGLQHPVEGCHHK